MPTTIANTPCEDEECSDVSEEEGQEDSGVPGRLSALLPRKLFGDDEAVRKGLLQVYVRVKPVACKLVRCMAIEKEGLVKATWKNKEALYKFSKVFPEDSGQQAIYAGVAEPLVADLLGAQQPEAVIMAYGVTSAGKTFTMQGTQERPGLVPQALDHIFKQLGSAAGSSSMVARVVVSAYEIYNEVVYDLLALARAPAGAAGAAAAAARPALKLKEMKGCHIAVQGAAEAEVCSAKEALDLLRRAAKARQSAGTGINQHSSRSHAIYTIKLVRGPAVDRSTDCAGGIGEGGEGQGGGRGTSEGPCEGQGGASVVTVGVGEGGGQLQASYLHFVDLAGCERVARTGNSGARLRESVAINSSLMTLARCLEVLRYNQMHPADPKVIPYRESKITHLFKAILTGHGRFALLVNVSPAADEFNETKRVLEYAALASKIKMTSQLAAPHEAPGATAAAAIAAEAAEEQAALAARVAALQARLMAADARVEELLDEKADLEYDLDVMDRKVELLREELVRAEVEKESLEAEVRAEVMADVAQLVRDAGAKGKEESAKAREEAARAREEAAQLRDEAARLREEAACAREDAARAVDEATCWREEAGKEEKQVARVAGRLRDEAERAKDAAARAREGEQAAKEEAARAKEEASRAVQELRELSQKVKQLEREQQAAQRQREELQHERSMCQQLQAEAEAARADAQVKANLAISLEAKLQQALEQHETEARQLRQQLIGLQQEQRAACAAAGQEAEAAVAAAPLEAARGVALKRQKRQHGAKAAAGAQEKQQAGEEKQAGEEVGQPAAAAYTAVANEPKQQQQSADNQQSGQQLIEDHQQQQQQQGAAHGSFGFKPTQRRRRTMAAVPLASAAPSVCVRTSSADAAACQGEAEAGHNKAANAEGAAAAAVEAAAVPQAEAAAAAPQVAAAGPRAVRGSSKRRSSMAARGVGGVVRAAPVAEVLETVEEEAGACEVAAGAGLFGEASRSEAAGTAGEGLDCKPASSRGRRGRASAGADLLRSGAGCRRQLVVGSGGRDAERGEGAAAAAVGAKAAPRGGSRRCRTSRAHGLQLSTVVEENVGDTVTEAGAAPAGVAAGAGAAVAAGLRAGRSTKVRPANVKAVVRLPALAEEGDEQETVAADVATAEDGSKVHNTHQEAKAAAAAAAAAAATATPQAAQEEQWRPAADVLRELSAAEQQQGPEGIRAVGRRATIAAAAARPSAVGARVAAGGERASGGEAGKRPRRSWGAEEVEKVMVVGRTPVALRTRQRHPKV